VDTSSSLSILFAATRFAHFAACLILTGTFTFDRLILTACGEPRRTALAPPARQILQLYWNQITKWLVLAALPTALISGIAWFALVTITMSGLPPQEALHPKTLHLVWSQTQFGKVWQLRSILFLASLLATTCLFLLPQTSPLKTPLTWLATLLTAAFLATLAFVGHAQIGHPPTWHLLADALHLLVAALWPTGLLPLTLILLRLRYAPQDQSFTLIHQIINRFSTTALLSVALLASTGFLNSCYMLHSISDLTNSAYGRILLTKLSLFLIVIAFGAFNLLKLKPRLPNPRAARALQRTIAAELLLATSIILAVALLGLTPPPQL
jgi:copper resistance protein D